jgi:hypothetical protein
MKRMTVLFVAALAAGCGPTAAEPPAPPPDEGINFAGWPAATEQPHPVMPVSYSFCTAPSPQDPPARAVNPAEHGPHDRPAIVVRTSPEVIDLFRAGRSPLPVGAVVVKEKHDGPIASGPPAAYGAMVKREPGYDPAHGDWEYVYATERSEKSVTRGKLASCIECHARAKETDYLFRTYLPTKR